MREFYADVWCAVLASGRQRRMSSPATSARCSSSPSAAPRGVREEWPPRAWRLAAERHDEFVDEPRDERVTNRCPVMQSNVRLPGAHDQLADGPWWRARFRARWVAGRFNPQHDPSVALALKSSGAAILRLSQKPVLGCHSYRQAWKTPSFWPGWSTLFHPIPVTLHTHLHRRGTPEREQGARLSHASSLPR